MQGIGIKEDKMSSISIIVPVYNAETYLPKCLDSLTNQTVHDIEIICVNDGSSDNSLSVLKKYQDRDNRIVIVDKANEGVSRARNDALVVSTGRYIMFVDSDDWLELDTCEKALYAMEKYESDVVMWSYVSENDGSQSYKEIFPEDRVFDREQTQKELHRRFIGILEGELSHPELADALCPVWGKLYKRNLIIDNQIGFIDLSEIGTYEDGMFNLEVFRYVNKVNYLNECLYHYRIDNLLSVTSGYRDKLFEQWQNLFDMMNRYISENDLDQKYIDALDNRIALSILGLGLNIVEAEFPLRKKLRILKSIISQDHYRIAYKKLEFMYFPIHWKLFYGCAKYKVTLGLYVLLVVIKKIIG